MLNRWKRVVPLVGSIWILWVLIVPDKIPWTAIVGVCLLGLWALTSTMLATENATRDQPIRAGGPRAGRRASLAEAMRRLAASR